MEVRVPIWVLRKEDGLAVSQTHTEILMKKQKNDLLQVKIEGGGCIKLNAETNNKQRKRAIHVTYKRREPVEKHTN